MIPTQLNTIRQQQGRSIYALCKLLDLDPKGHNQYLKSVLYGRKPMTAEMADRIAGVLGYRIDRTEKIIKIITE